MTPLTVTPASHDGGMDSERRSDLPPAAADLWCWLHAAFPPRPDGALDVDRIAQALDVGPDTVGRWAADRYFEPSPDQLDAGEIRRLAADYRVAQATVRRWITEDDLDDDQWATLRRRAILRGHGHPLWPGPDDHTRRQQARQAANAARSWQQTRTRPADTLPAAWARQGWLEPHRVLIAHQRAAWVNRVSVTRSASTRSARTFAGAELVADVEVPNRHAAAVVLHAVLNHVEDWRALPPRELLATGRTEAWRDTAPPVELDALAATALT